MNGAAPRRARGGALARSFYDRSPTDVAPDLLGKILVGGDGRRGRITEVEAYGGADDPASHAYRGRTARNASMWGPPGHLYVYFTYGMHWCANVTCLADGAPGAVLIRAAQPLEQLDAMRAARWRSQRSQLDRDLCRGPGRLCQAMGWDGAFDGADLVTADRGPTVVDDATPPPAYGTGPRVGVRAGADRPWRWAVTDGRWVSGAVPGVSAPVDGTRSGPTGGSPPQPVRCRSLTGTASPSSLLPAGPPA